MRSDRRAALEKELATHDPQQCRLRCDIAAATAALDAQRVAELKALVPRPRTPTNKGALGRIYGGHSPAAQPRPAALALAAGVKQNEDLRFVESLEAGGSLRIACTVCADEATAAAAPDAAPGSPTIRAVAVEDAELAAAAAHAPEAAEAEPGAAAAHRGAWRLVLHLEPTSVHALVCTARL